MTFGSRTLTRKSAVGFALLAGAVLLAALMATAFGQGPTPVSAQVSSDSTCQTFPETGFKVCGRFLDYWNSHGGLAQQGLPISNEFDETNPAPPAGDGQVHRVQYFQRARFEYHPENQAPYDVLLGLLGSEQYAAKYGPTPTPTPSPTPTPAPVGPACLGDPATINGTVAEACVSTPNPAQNTNVTVYAKLVSEGNGVPSATMDTVWHFQSGNEICGGTPDKTGLISCSLNIGYATVGVPVLVEVHLRFNNNTFTVTATFTPRAAS